MNVPRKQVSLAVFNLLTAVAPPGSADWAFSERSLTMYSELEAGQQPYLGMLCDNQRASQDRSFGATKWELHYTIQIYFQRGPQDRNFGDSIDDFIDDIEASLATFPLQNTLGGLVVNCFIDGEVLVNPAIITGQAGIQIPITVLSGI
jgi:hypothetical protein